jgi:ribose-phosphate pyrophosphokinase
MILNLDKNFKPYEGTEIEFEKFIFSGGEPHIKINPNIKAGTKITVTTRIQSFNDFGILCLAVDALKRMDLELNELFIPYFPAARQDRVMIKGEPLSVKVYADIINTFGFKKVCVFDAHSEVTQAVLEKCDVIPNHAYIKEITTQLNEEIVLISPDGGALKKIYKLSEYLGGIEVVECSKSRNVKTGKLSGFKVYTDDLAGKTCLVVDDICDGGGTFIGLAEELKKKNAGKLMLAVSHGIFNKGFEQLNCFDRIFTTNSFKDFEGTEVTQIKLSF